MEEEPEVLNEIPLLHAAVVRISQDCFDEGSNKALWGVTPFGSPAMYILSARDEKEREGWIFACIVSKNHVLRPVMYIHILSARDEKEGKGGYFVSGLDWSEIAELLPCSVL